MQVNYHQVGKIPRAATAPRTHEEWPGWPYAPCTASRILCSDDSAIAEHQDGRTGQ